MTEVEKDAAPGLREASAVLASAYDGVAVKPGKGVPNARAVASALRLVGCSSEVQLAGLLDDVVEDTGWTVGDVRARFGRPVAELVDALTEDGPIVNHRPRKRALREQIARAGADAIDIALADKVASIGYVLSSDGKLAKRKPITRRSRRSVGRRRIRRGSCRCASFSRSSPPVADLATPWQWRAGAPSGAAADRDPRARRGRTP